MRLGRFEMDVIGMAMSLSLSGAGREGGFGYSAIADPAELAPEALASCQRCAQGAAEEAFELWAQRPAGAAGQGPRSELRERSTGAGLTLHWGEQGAQGEPIAVEIDQAALFERLATPQALAARQASEEGALWSEELEREAFILSLAEVWAAFASPWGESARFAARLLDAPQEIAPGAGVYGPASHELTDKLSGARWRVSRADNGILSLESVERPATAR